MENDYNNFDENMEVVESNDAEEGYEASPYGSFGWYLRGF